MEGVICNLDAAV